MYHFGVSGLAVWIMHILLGLLLAYIGYRGVGDGKITKNLSLILLVTGVLAATYHAHILIINRNNQ